MGIGHNIFTLQHLRNNKLKLNRSNYCCYLIFHPPFSLWFQESERTFDRVCVLHKMPRAAFLAISLIFACSFRRLHSVTLRLPRRANVTSCFVERLQNLHVKNRRNEAIVINVIACAFINLAGALIQCHIQVNRMLFSLLHTEKHSIFTKDNW